MPDLDEGRPSPVLKFHNLDPHIMDLDLDLDSPWPLDQISMSPFLISSSTEQPCSPLWAFSDSFDEKLLPIPTAAATVNGGIRLSDYSRLLTCNPPNMESKPTEEDEESRNHPSSFLGLENLDRYGVIKQRMAQALRYFKESTDQPQHVLAQVWAPVKNGNRYFLTTSGQPFVLDPSSGGLHGYRLVSLMYMFSVDGENEGELGLPGRVFKQKVPEWTPDVQYYSSKEYSRLSHALHYNVHGTLALPVFEPTGKACVGVLELILTSQKINYAPEVDKVCKALEAVNLKSSEILNHSNNQVSKDMVFVDNMICNEGRHIALEEILEILTLVCETHKLPLAQTWVPCRHRSVIADGGGLKKSCSSFDGNCMGQICMSTTDVACYLVDAQVWGFRDACLEHHLQKGQGVAGRAFLSHGSCFCGDITQFCKTQYPLVHYARMFKLTGCFAICLRSGFTGNDEYVLEFFLPLDKTDSYEQHALLRSLLATMKQHMKSLWVASGKELDEEEMCIEIIDASSISERRDATSPEPVQKSAEAPYNGVRDMDEGNGSKEQQQVKVLEAKPDDNGENSAKAVGNENVASSAETKPVKKSEKKRGKAEKQISLDVLQQYFAGSLKDAAKSLGVCPTTMKRICRQHGISRWPSRKINKVNRSLSKLKRVIESVQGTEEALGLGGLSTSPLPIAVGSISWPSSFKGSNEQSPLGRNTPEPLTNKIQSPSPNTPGSEDDAGPNHPVIRRFSSQDQLVYEGTGLETLNIPNQVKTGSSSREESSGSPTSHGSSNNGNLPTKEPNFPVPSPIPNGLLTTELQEPFGGMLIEDAGSSKDLRDLDPMPESSWTKPNPNPNVGYAPCAPPPFLPQTAIRQDMRSVTIKATYREDIIRFRISVTSNVVELKEQVAKRLKLEVGIFDIKYLDDDREWVLIACDADWQECVDVSRSSGCNMIRLLVHDINAILGSSCESSGE